MTRLYGTPGISEWKEQDGVWEQNHDDRGQRMMRLYGPPGISKCEEPGVNGVCFCVVRVVIAMGPHEPEVDVFSKRKRCP